MTNIFILRSKKKNIAYVCYEKKKIISYVGKNGIGKKNRETGEANDSACKVQK